ncbi:HesA/MoeB/ThiF family protein [Thermohalobaculum sediminis]|uniref:HesA/MoeB/ThiF family protein n=1 Tax=Thermohalobaculum sediminis TaxID=2939436 RepID=UPI003872E4A4
MSFDRDELERYARHIVLHEIGGPGQQRLKRARVLVVGAGGLGSPAILYLAAAGVGRLGVVDDDEVSLSNLQRQVLHHTDEVGAPKTESAGRAVARLNPHVEVVPHALRLDEENAASILADYDLVLDGSDNFSTRYLVNRAAARLGKPLVFAAIGRWEGQVAVFDPARGGPCYECIFPEPPAPGLVPACAEAGVLGAMAGVVGAMQAVEAVKLIVQAGEPLRGRLMLYDALGAEARVIRVRRREGCAVCAGAGQS